jgi:hypothetical protein
MELLLLRVDRLDLGLSEEVPEAVNTVKDLRLPKI